MKINGYESEKFILNELGSRIKQRRISLEITQAELAARCGISPSTETRIENGDDAKMSNYIRILSALGLLENMDILIPETRPDFSALYEGKKPRQRVRPGKQDTVSDWVWGEDM